MTMPPRPLVREDMLAALRAQPCWDLLIVGGGATGLGCALDAAARGLKVALVEAGDFAQGTSSRSTKLIHGGVRYLAQGNLALVREGLRERTLLLRNAPAALAAPLDFIIPAYRRRDLLMYAAGLKLYDALAGRQGLARSRVLGAAQVCERAPAAARHDPAGRPLRGGVLYQDGQFDDSRLAVALLRTACAQGAVALNYCRVVGLLKEGGRVTGATVADGEGGGRFDLRARVVVNATGAWVDGLRGLDKPGAQALVAPSQGAHIVLDGAFLPGGHALLLPRTADGRVVFCLPWLGRTLVGTTDTACTRLPEPAQVRPLDAEVEFLLAAAGQVLARQPARADIRASFAGLRPLVRAQAGVPTRRLSREHTIAASDSGLLTVTGGKWTTYRHMAEQVVDAACAQAGLRAGPSRTASLPLLAPVYGPGTGAVLHPDFPYTEDDVRNAWRYEMARTADDVLERRTRLALLDERAAEDVRPAVEALLEECRKGV